MRTACTLTKIENSLLPDKISALFHVVEIIDEMLMSPEEAVIKSAGTNQLRWINRLLETFDGDLTAAILRAAANGHLDMMQRLFVTSNGCHVVPSLCEHGFRGFHERGDIDEASDSSDEGVGENDDLGDDSDESAEDSDNDSIEEQIAVKNRRAIQNAI
ncbi:hypothetical protein F441_19749 [Phytophthora nicotianae CJ01A1]|uniref:Uncharacterized protein n=4 Tax=Phytophthora nicotianae TaxID=4792 RepID=W2Y8N3_PHYNI|nr:hypothetical protein L917_19064 [Phytophthora nicotianae]ETO62195.1 hypothetical protein F444_19877 [Phytophthora nicotianae P1976]ETP03277.1 hypothetical protein F441_19749 [Phytophthora nicotianae CJ01A1]ETP31445.1 hypothetical protein F442_19693 [Phytophthora nicotianae P10297]